MRRASRSARPSTTCRPGLVAALDTHLRAHAAGDRLLEALEELQTIRRETGWPPLAAPIGQILASQALIHVLSARRYGTVVDEFRALVQGRYGSPPAKVDADGRARRHAPLGRNPARRGPADRRGRPPGGRGARRQRGGARPDRALRRGGGSAAADDPGARDARGLRHADARAEPRAADPRARPDRAGERRRRGRDRGRGDAGLRQAHRGAARRSSSAAAPLAEDELADLPVLPAAAAGADPRRVADGRRLLPRRRARRARLRRASATSSRPGRRSACSRR